MNIIENKYKILCSTQSDINEHLPTLRKYASECNSIFETGVRGCVSSWAFLYGLLNNTSNNRKKLFLNDINKCNIQELKNAAKGLNIEVKHIWKNNLEIELDHNYDIVFIDTWHVYAQLKRELEKFHKRTNKYIIMHDTTTDGIYGETVRNKHKMNAIKQSIESGFPVEEINKGLWPAIEEFLSKNKNWELKEKFDNNNGLTILAKKL